MIKSELGHVYSRLTVVAAAGSIKGQGAWMCVCTCGVSKVVTGTHLRRGQVRSCGCLQAEVMRSVNLTHGLTRTPTNITWQSMRARCNLKTHKYYSNYGGKGIKVCERWNDYTKFLADMGERPAGMSLDRIDGNKGYEPSNCQWATRTEQNRNSSQNRMIEYRGKIQCLSAWCEELNRNYDTTHRRLFQLKWSIKDAFEKPTQAHARGAVRNWQDSVPAVRQLEA